MIEARTAVVTGARGFLARNLIERLHADGWTVYGVSREAFRSDHAHILTWESFWRGETLDPAAIQVLFHAAAFMPPNMEDPAYARACLESNALLSLQLAEFMVAHGRARFIYFAAGNVYGYREAPADEQTPTQVHRRACFYLSSKLLGETFVERARVLQGLNAASFRISTPYGSWMSSRATVSVFAERARRGEPLPLRHGGREQFDMIHVGDVVETLVRAATSTAQGVFNLGTGCAITVKAIADAVNAAFSSAAGVCFVEPQDVPPQQGFAPLCTRHTIATFGHCPLAFASGLARYRSWLDAQPSS